MDLTGIGSIADFASGVVKRIFPEKMSESEKTAAKIQLEQMLQSRETAVLETQKAVMVAELTQGDSYTKRARPTLVYSGLFFIFLVHVFFPIMAWTGSEKIPTLTLPSEFWWAWTGVCSAWIIGRSAEKRGAGGKLGQAAKLITGGL